MKNVIAIIVLLVSVVIYAQIAPTRAAEIQHALQAHGYHIQATGVFDSQTYNVLKSIAKAHGWQHVSVPDARVLQVIGLGPVITGLVNPETADIPVGSKIRGIRGDKVLRRYRREFADANVRAGRRVLQARRD